MKLSSPPTARRLNAKESPSEAWEKLFGGKFLEEFQG